MASEILRRVLSELCGSERVAAICKMEAGAA